MKQINFVVTSITLLLVSACGGGGGSTPTTTTPVVQTCANGGSNYPTCTAPVIPASLQQAVAPTYPLDSSAYATFVALNEVRASMGLGPLNQHKLLDQATLDYHNYLQTSFIAGEPPHIEVAGRPNFTGALPINRALFVGYSTPGASEVITAEIGKMAVVSLMDTTYHRAIVTSDVMTEIGIYSGVNTIINMGMRVTQKNASNYVGTYPVDKQTSVALTHALETPNPTPDIAMTVADVCTKTSYPISLQTQSDITLRVTSFSIREFGTVTDLPARLLTNSSDKLIGENTAFLIGHSPFKKYTTYTVHFVGTGSDGKGVKLFDIDKTWSFTTGVNYVTCPNL